MTMFPVPVSAAAVPAHQGLSAEDVRRIQEFLDRSVSSSTRAAYSSAWCSFEKWADGRAVMATPALVAGYLSHLAEERKVSVATVRLHRAALAAVNRAAGHEDHTDNEGVRRILQGISRAHGRALAAVTATAGHRRQLGQGEKGREPAQRASGGPWWTLPCCLSCGMGSSPV